ncbi:MAG TPA: hypothetical protein VFR67_29020 [Pilimelia sp.]|nr:hypothetical protein [Pilimelia sp.]
MNEEENEVRGILAPLREPQAGPSGPCSADVARAIAQGRRTIRRRRLAGAGGVAGVTALAVVALPVIAGAWREAPAGGTGVATPSITRPPAVSPGDRRPGGVPAQCTAARLPVPDGVNRSIVTGVDPTGRFVLGRSYPGGSSHQVLIWDNGTPKRIAVPGADQALNDANSAGVAIGSSFQSDKMVPWVYKDGKVTRLHGVQWGAPIAIGETGRIVGYRGASVSVAEQTPVVWSSPEAEAVDLPLPGNGWRGSVSSVGPDGTVVGTVTPPGAGAEGDRAKGYLWAPDGSVRMLPVPTIDGVPAAGFSASVIDGDWVVGYAARYMPQEKVFEHIAMRLNLRTNEWAPYPVVVPYNFTAVSINNRGWMAGLTGFHDHERPAVVSDAGLRHLPEYRGLTKQRATGISDDGRVIAGQGDDSGNRVQALIWRCR